MPKDWRGSRYQARSRGSVSRAVWLWGQTAVGLSPPWKPRGFFPRSAAFVENSAENSIDLNKLRSKFCFVPSMEILFYTNIHGSPLRKMILKS